MRRYILIIKTVETIDAGASICMDIILSDFIEYYQKCSRGRHTVKVDEVIPINFDRYEIKKILFSIGAFKNIRGFKINYENIIDFPMIIGNNKSPHLPAKREVDITKTVDYIISCIENMNKTLTAGSRNQFIQSNWRSSSKR